jgi:hypothetical protein
MDLVDELRQLIETLRTAQVDYALCGGFALAAHGIVRATEDIDVILEEGSLEALQTAVEPLGYFLQPERFSFKEGTVKIRRFVKTEERDSLLLDVLTVTPAIRGPWQTRSVLQTHLGPVPVISRSGLITLKLLRGSGQDMDDIERLRQQ